MAARVDYLASDYDQRAHATGLRLDLQDLDLPDAHLDAVLSSGVVEHVPDTDAVLREVWRALRPGGSLILLVPVLQGATAPPAEPEFHGDATPVFWRFGPDLTARLREHGYDVALLCTADFARHARAGRAGWLDVSGEFDAAGIVEAVDPGDLRVVLDDAGAERLGLTPGYMYLAWHARRPASGA